MMLMRPITEQICENRSQRRASLDELGGGSRRSVMAASAAVITDVRGGSQSSPGWRRYSVA